MSPATCEQRSPISRRGLVEDLLAAPGDDHLRPGRRELDRRLLAEVGAAARDEHHAPGERLGREDLRGRRRQGRAGEPGFEPGFMVLETMRIAVNSLPRGVGRHAYRADAVRTVCEHVFVRTSRQTPTRTPTCSARIWATATSPTPAAASSSSSRSTPSIRTSSRSAGPPSCSALPASRPRRNRTPCTARFASRLGAEHWPDLFPQMGPGRKHERPIVLAPWQREIVDAHPWPFVRGLIHSDGCRTVNRFKTRLPSGRVAEYAYPRYFFSNLSADIRGAVLRELRAARAALDAVQPPQHLDLASHERRAARRERGAEVLSATPRRRAATRGPPARRSRAARGQQVRPAQAVQLARHRLAGLLHDLDAARAAHEVEAHEGAVVAAGLQDEHVGALGCAACGPRGPGAARRPRA